jgi:hypothetical protein
MKDLAANGHFGGASTHYRMAASVGFKCDKAASINCEDEVDTGRGCQLMGKASEEQNR